MFPSMCGEDIQLKMRSYFGSIQHGRKKMDGSFFNVAADTYQKGALWMKKNYFKDEFVALWWKSCEKSANVNVFLSVLRVPPKLLFLEKRAYIFSLSCIWFYK